MTDARFLPKLSTKRSTIEFKPRTAKQVKTDNLLSCTNGLNNEVRILSDILADKNSRDLYFVPHIENRITRLINSDPS